MPTLSKTLEAVSGLTMRLFGLRENLVMQMKDNKATIKKLRSELNACYIEQDSLERELVLLDDRLKRSASLVANLTEVMASGDGYTDIPVASIQKLEMYHECSEMVN